MGSVVFVLTQIFKTIISENISHRPKLHFFLYFQAVKLQPTIIFIDEIGMWVFFSHTKEALLWEKIYIEKKV